ncbi:hypothetical protein SAMN04489724_0179 [Algoriphagus locisalis]|uniref:Uncharacterized protein n=1 Tax=Algoriphagus locisalis TaxID=305507 RepID=A0A1I7E6Z9_9BACT|nr:hypothetical protein SAMN04489724_0179 [Algoriphagus locisalis]
MSYCKPFDTNDINWHLYWKWQAIIQVTYVELASYFSGISYVRADSA